jgi:hypothetical protein
MKLQLDKENEKLKYFREEKEKKIQTRCEEEKNILERIKKSNLKKIIRLE